MYVVSFGSVTTLTNHSEIGTPAAQIREVRPHSKIPRDSVNRLHSPRYHPQRVTACLMRIASEENAVGTINIESSNIMKKVIISIACCALVAPLALAKDKKGKELKGARLLAETPMTVTVTAPSPNQRVEGAMAASYQPPGTIVVRQDGPGLYVLEARGHVFNSRGEMVAGPITPGTRMHVYFSKDDAGLQTVDRVVID
jgi:hypothetical protein